MGTMNTECQGKCLGNIPGIRHAYCGHGDKNKAYVLLEDGTFLKGYDAKIYIKKLKEEEKC